jgi:hypothetical protein
LSERKALSQKEQEKGEQKVAWEHGYFFGVNLWVLHEKNPILSEKLFFYSNIQHIKTSPKTMSSAITCPSCGHQFEATEAFREEVKREMNARAEEWQKKKEAEYRLKEAEFTQKLAATTREMEEKARTDRQKWEQEAQEQLRKTIAGDYESRLTALQNHQNETEEKLKSARLAETEVLRLQMKLKDQEEETNLLIQKKLLEERDRLREHILQEERQKLDIKETEHQLQLKELQKQLEDQKGLIEQMKRKSEQGSMQMQGEVQELLLEEMLRKTFPFDQISEVGKGVRGADCLQLVRNAFGQEVGKIIYESKRTKDFGADLIDKLKADMRSQGADVAVLVSQALPKDMDRDRFGEKEGVYICGFTEVRGVALLLRNGLLRIADARKSQENKGDKMVMLYDYLTGNEFVEQWKAIREGFSTMKLSIQRERDAMEKLWKAREKQLEKVLLNAAHIRGSIEGIAGADAVNLTLEDDSDPFLLAE